MKPREYLSDDWDLEQNRLVIFAGGNGDWYVSVVEGDNKVGPAVRITTSGARLGYEGVALHIARAYRALPEQVIAHADGGVEDFSRESITGEAAEAEKAEPPKPEIDVFSPLHLEAYDESLEKMERAGNVGCLVWSREVRGWLRDLTEDVRRLGEAVNEGRVVKS